MSFFEDFGSLCVQKGQSNNWSISLKALQNQPMQLIYRARFEVSYSVQFRPIMATNRMVLDTATTPPRKIINSIDDFLVPSQTWSSKSYVAFLLPLKIGKWKRSERHDSLKNESFQCHLCENWTHRVAKLKLLPLRSTPSKN